MVYNIYIIEENEKEVPNGSEYVDKKIYVETRYSL
jgi:hypothetical protein